LNEIYFKKFIFKIGIGIMSNIIMFPPAFLLVQLFRRSKRKVTRKQMLDKVLNEIRTSKSEEYGIFFLPLNSDGRKNNF
jgi:hypothetical protein